MAGRKKGTPKTGGRKKGSVNKVTADLKAAIIEAFGMVGGANYLVEQASANPTAFLTLIGKVLPMTISGDPENPLKSDVTVRFVGNSDTK